MQKLFLAAAHSNPPLDELVNELREIENALRPNLDEGLWNIISNRAASLEDIFDTFNREQSQIRLFHFSGHSSSSQLAFDKGGNIEGLAGLFGLSKPNASGRNPLQLVFLNGCSSLPMVKALHDVGIGMVIATSCAVGDQAARDFAKSLYQTWVIEGTSLQKAFNSAKAFLQSATISSTREIGVRDISITVDPNFDEFPWGGYPNPNLSDSVQNELWGWQLNPKHHSFSMIIPEIKTKSNRHLLELVSDFELNGIDVQNEVAAGGNPLLILIHRLPWIVGTHLRRIFALDRRKDTLESDQNRLKELVIGYSEITRFLCYITLSILCDFTRKEYDEDFIGTEKIIRPFSKEPMEINHLSLMRYYRGLIPKNLENDPIGILEHIDIFLTKTEHELAEKILFMENLKKEIEYIVSNPSKIKDSLWQSEVVFTEILRSILFLAQYKLFTIRSISVDKIRFLDNIYPYTHKTMTLHAAFSKMNLISTKREIATENYCLLLSSYKSSSNDPLQNALNLSPFYIDRTAWLEASKIEGGRLDALPAIFVLHQYFASTDEYEYIFIDQDRSYQYLFSEDHQIKISSTGADFPSGLNISLNESLRFSAIHSQLNIIFANFSE